MSSKEANRDDDDDDDDEEASSAETEATAAAAEPLGWLALLFGQWLVRVAVWSLVCALFGSAWFLAVVCWSAVVLVLLSMGVLPVVSPDVARDHPHATLAFWVVPLWEGAGRVLGQSAWYKRVSRQVRSGGGDRWVLLLGVVLAGTVAVLSSVPLLDVLPVRWPPGHDSDTAAQLADVQPNTWWHVECRGLPFTVTHLPHPTIPGQLLSVPKPFVPVGCVAVDVATGTVMTDTEGVLAGSEQQGDLATRRWTWLEGTGSRHDVEQPRVPPFARASRLVCLAAAAASIPTTMPTRVSFSFYNLPGHSRSQQHKQTLVSSAAGTGYGVGDDSDLVFGSNGCGGALPAPDQVVYFSEHRDAPRGIVNTAWEAALLTFRSRWPFARLGSFAKEW